MLSTTLGPIEAKRKSPVHFAGLNHDTRVAIIHCISQLPIRVVAIAINKRELNTGHTLQGERRLHFYASRYLLERISWIARDRAKPNEGDGKCSLTFSHCKGLSYSKLGEYFETLKKSNSQVAWGSLDTEKIKVLGHAQSIWLRAADATASGTAQALELSAHGFCEYRYIRMLKPVIYKNGNNYLSYGMKMFPNMPTVQKERDNRYEWLSLYRRW